VLKRRFGQHVQIVRNDYKLENVEEQSHRRTGTLTVILAILFNRKRVMCNSHIVYYEISIIILSSFPTYSVWLKSIDFGLIRLPNSTSVIYLFITNSVLSRTSDRNFSYHLILVK